MLLPPRFDLQLAQALGESAFERSLREKVTQENSSLRWEMGKLQQSLEVSRGWPTCFASQSRSSSQSEAILCNHSRGKASNVTGLF